MYYVYHIHRPNMSLSEGYIGVTNNPTRRFKEHKSSNYIVGSAIRKYEDVTMTIILIGSSEYCYTIEHQLRPQERIGWNIDTGGKGTAPRYGKDNPATRDEVRLLISKNHADVSGENNGRAVLCALDVANIRYHYNNGTPTKELVAYYKVHRNTIHNVIVNKCWKDIKPAKINDLS